MRRSTAYFAVIFALALTWLTALMVIIIPNQNEKSPAFATIVGYTRRPNFCKLEDNDDPEIIILVTSKSSHRKIREIHRKSFGSDFLRREFSARRVFLLARDSGYSMDDEAEETTKYNDIVMGDFNESYANLALKHLMGLLWIRNECSSSSTKLVIKSDDDIAVDWPRFINKSRKELVENPLAAMAGWLHSGMHVRRSRSKWAVTSDDYKGQTYPDFLSGWAYAMSKAVSDKIADEAAANAVNGKPFWIDDVWISGMIRAALRIPLTSWSQYYTPYKEHVECCVNDANDNSYACDYLVGPTDGDTRLLANFGKLSMSCYQNQTSCSKRRPWSKSIWNTCKLDNPLFLPETAGVGHVVYD